jgi:adenylate cyclase
MFTDMVGYTAASQADEKATLALRKEQEAILRPLLTEHQGRKVKSTGDGLLVEFESALKATECAVNIQRRLHERNAKNGITPINLRIGIHLGDVEQQGTDIFGDAVNIASRIEPLASPGGVCVSGEVFSQIRNKIPNKFEKLPPTGLKGVQVSIEIYRVILPWTNRELASETSGPAGIAVLPFINISPDPKDEYFADGLTEELITVLSQLRELRVISRTSVMLYKATPKSASQIGAELGVVSILEGSVRKAGSRLRVTAQLIDARSDRHLWAKTYDRELDDVFAVQAEIAKQVAEALEVELRPTEESRLESRPAVRPDSYLAYLKGRTLFHSFSKESLEAAKEQFELAISLDSQNAAAHAGLADVIRVIGLNYSDFPREDWEETSRRLATRAIDLDPSLAEAHTSLALILWTDYDFTAAEKEFKLALSLNPSYSLAHYTYAAFMQDEGRTDEALQEHALAEAADPLSSLNLAFLAQLLINLGKLDEAFVKIQRMGELEPDSLSYHLASVAYHLARSDLEQGLKEIRRIVELQPAPRDKQLAQAFYYALSGEKEQARALLRQDQTLPDRPRMAHVIARIYAELGDLDECFRWLEMAIGSRFIAIRSWRLDPRFERVRRDPRFRGMLKKLNLA